MARDGSGNYLLPSGNPVVTNTIISSSGWANPTLSDIASALTQSLSRDGQTTPTADLTMGNFKLRNLANALARTDAVNAGQIQDGGLITLGSVAGTDTITASSAPAITSYVSGQQFRFIAAGANITGIPTLNINGLGPKNLTRFGTQNLSPGDFQTGSVVTATYDGTQMQVVGIVNASSIIGAARNVSMILPAASATATLSADELMLQTAIGGFQFKLSNFSKTINLATTGAGGMDTGSSPVSGFVAIYVIYNPTTGASALLAQNASSARANVYTGANMPAGYTASMLCGVYPTNGSGQLVAGAIVDRAVSFAASNVLSSSATPGAYTSIPLGAIVPLNAKSVSGFTTYQSTTASSAMATNIAAHPTTVIAQRAGQAIGTGNLSFERMPLIVAQTIYYTSNNGAGTFGQNTYITGFEF